MPKFQFKAHIIDQGLPRGAYAQTALVDLDNDDRLGLTLSDNLESILTELEAQLGAPATPEATDISTS